MTYKSGTASGDLSGTYPAPSVAAVHETGGPTKLTFGAIPDGDFIVRSGTTLIGAAGAPPTGTAGGDLTGSYPNPTLADAVVDTIELVNLAVTTAKLADVSVTTGKIALLAVTDAQVAAANKDGASGTASMRTLGTGAAQACAGNDSRLSDSRAPTGAAGGDLASTYPNPQVAALHETSGPTKLTIGTIADGQFLKRSGSTITSGASAGGGGTTWYNTTDLTIPAYTSVVVSRTLQMVAPAVLTLQTGAIVQVL